MQPIKIYYTGLGDLNGEATDMTWNTQKAIESLYCGKCDISVTRKTINLVTKQTEFQDDIIITNQPCRLSYISAETRSSSINKETRTAEKKQIIKLFLSPTINVPSGSKITVTQNGKTTEYKASSEPMMYSNHQEVELEILDKWA